LLEPRTYGTLARTYEFALPNLPQQEQENILNKIFSLRHLAQNVPRYRLQESGMSREKNPEGFAMTRLQT
jgi:hypothetical protein